MNLQDLIVKTTKAFADQIAIKEGSEQITYIQLNNFVNKVANAFIKNGVKKGDRVGLYLKNSYRYLIFRMAMEKVGIVYIPINYFLSSKEIQHILQDSGAKALICDEQSYQKCQTIETTIEYFFIADDTVQKNTKGIPLFYYNDIINHYSHQEPIQNTTNENDLCSINYTSGTTGKAKGVMLSQRNWIEVYKNMLINRDIRSNDHLLHLGPLTHASGAYFMPFFLKGAQNIIIPNGFNIDLFFEYLETYQISAFTCVPTVLNRIMNDPRIRSVDKSNLRMIGYGAAPMSPQQIKKALEIFGPKLVQNYGQTEAYMTVSFLSQEEHQEALENSNHRLASIGKPYTFVQVEIMDDNGNLLEPNHVGELVVHSKHVMEGYWNLPEETKKTFRNGWLLTGDLAKKDEDGYIYLLGRKKEMIISGGFNIYPREIEDVLYQCDLVIEAAVLGIEDEDWGEKVVAFLVLHKNTSISSLDEIKQVCKNQLGYKNPKEFILLNSLPKNSIGKIDKKELKKMYCNERGAEIG
ncbi:class I adenylate-forming enzyme family protein [Alkalihalobacillus sp. BA299]|uniref:class I adenylate-forming enzyme family protein n=1 Tax=Alkalihalobacillus sp. BA299 TaxID=2815938 RepID=UPI001ADA61DD|nr:AMP-binding protein [Alkalihalobacillus sp. BA299]